MCVSQPLRLLIAISVMWHNMDPYELTSSSTFIYIAAVYVVCIVCSIDLELKRVIETNTKLSC